MEYHEQIRQILVWLSKRPDFAAYFFENPDAALDDLVASGFEVERRTRAYFTKRNPVKSQAELEQRLDETFPSWRAAGGDYDLAFPIQEESVGFEDSGFDDWGDGDDGDEGSDSGASMSAGGDDGGFDDFDGDPQPATPKNIDAKPAEKVVSTGFAEEESPDTPIEQQPLTPGAAYYFWLEVGKPVQNSIERVQVELPVEKLPPEASLRVVLYAFDGQLEIMRGADVGGLKVLPNGRVVVEKPVSNPAAPISEEMLNKRLFFPIRTPQANGRYQIRCNIYYQNTLVQGRVITAQVGQPNVNDTEPLLVADVDYTLSHSLNGNQLEAMGKTRLSIMLNDNGNGTHGFRFFGGDEVKSDATLGEGVLTQTITVIRGLMRKAAWGDTEPYQNGKKYRYTGGIDLHRLKKDLIFFAQEGYKFYDQLIGQMVRDVDTFELADLMLKPGQLQLASKESAQLVVPIALFYDYDLDPGQRLSKYNLCETFAAALQNSTPLEETPCFQGDCPHRADLLTVCPSGFWGYRHSLGLPVSIRSAPDAPIELKMIGEPTIDMSVSTDPNFRERPGHEQRLESMGVRGAYADSRDKALALMKQSEAEIIYFYCHGGLDRNGLPYLSLGPVGQDRFMRANLRASRIRWRKTRPLVFINGCHTTALSPESALDLVSGFVETSHAAGVIGTEITIFEPIATQFAEEFFRLFLLEKQNAGESIRGARLKILQEGNPLGLVYIPYVMPSLRLT